MNAPGSLLISICVPTYNRAGLLRRCLQSVLPQIHGLPVEVVVIDNASTDGTEAAVRELLPGNPGLRYFRNAANLGYTGNQIKCIEYGGGKYTAILCDDDVYTPDAIATMIPVLEKGDFSFVALNYYAFLADPSKVERVVGPHEDMLRQDAYEIWDTLGVGHYSGLVLNTQLARAALPEVLNLFTREQFEHFRGILGLVAIKTIKSSSFPGYFIGKPIVGAGVPPVIDYDKLSHICMDAYEIYYTFFQKGAISEKELEFRRAAVLADLPNALLRDGGGLSSEKLREVTAQLTGWFGNDPRFARSARLLGFLKFAPVRLFLRLLVRIHGAVKQAPSSAAT